MLEISSNDFRDLTSASSLGAESAHARPTVGHGKLLTIANRTVRFALHAITFDRHMPHPCQKVPILKTSEINSSRDGVFLLQGGGRRGKLPKVCTYAQGKERKRGCCEPFSKLTKDGGRSLDESVSHNSHYATRRCTENWPFTGLVQSSLKNHQRRTSQQAEDRAKTVQCLHQLRRVLGEPSPRWPSNLGP